MDMHLKDKLALVTGSTKGIGHAIALGLAREGARVIVNGRSPQSVDAALRALHEEIPGARVEGHAAGLSDARQINALVAKYPEVDVLVNNLGIFDPKPFEDIPDEDWQRFFDTNVEGVVDFVNKLSGGKSFEAAQKEFFETARPSSLLKRFITPEEVANMVVYLSSDAAAATNGAAMRVDGGVIRSAF